MSSLVIDSVELITGALVIGGTSHGVRGADLPSTGEDYASPIFDDVTLPADDDKEYRYAIESTDLPAGSYHPDDDSSLLIDAGVPDGTYTLTYRLFEDGVDLGTGTITIFIGVNGAHFAITLDDLVAGMSARVVVPLPLDSLYRFTLRARKRHLEISMSDVSNPGFSDKVSSERILIGFEFKKNFTAVASSPSPVVTVARFTGEADPSPSDMLDGAPIVSGTKVLQWVIGGVPGCRYDWTCTAYGADGQRHVLDGTMLVR